MTAAGYHKRRLNAIANGRWNPWVDADLVRRHIAELLAVGWSLRAIRHQANVPHSTLVAIVGGPGRRTSTRVSTVIAQRILAVAVPDINAGHRYIPAVGTRRRLQALALIGWGPFLIAERIGVDGDGLSRVVKGQRQHCLVSTARAVTRVFAELWDHPAPPSRHTSATRNRAAAAGWLPALAWDDIDDPTETPDPSIIRTPRSAQLDAAAETAEQVAELVARGWTSERIAERLGVTQRTVDRHRATQRQHQHQEAS